MQRRTLLKGSVAATAVAAIGMRRPQRSSAARRVRLIQQELPRYELISFHVTETFVVDGGENFRGIPRDISNNGTICGEIVFDGRLAPVVWDSGLSMSFLDMSGFEANSALASAINDSGLVTGSIAPIGQFQSESEAIITASATTQADPMLVWRNGLLATELMAAMPPGSFVNALTESGTMLGGVDETPARWLDGAMEPIALPGGFVAGGLRTQAASGAAAGTFYRSEDPLAGGVPFVVTSDGQVTVLDAPGTSDPNWPGRLQVWGLQDDGSFSAVVRGQSDLFGSAIRYAGGQQTPIADLSGEGMFVRSANSSGVMVGQSLRDGYSIPTMWVNDQPVVIADLIIPGPDLLLREVNGINDAGAMVGEASDSAGYFHHVLLRPVF